MGSVASSGDQTERSNEIAKAAPYFVFQKYPTKDALVIVTLDHTLTSDNLQDEQQNVMVYGDVITLSPQISLPGKSLTVHARIIKLIHDTTIDTSGKTEPLPYNGMTAHSPTPPTLPGVDGPDGAAGAHGNRGQDGGDISLFADAFEGLETYRLSLIADGSDGQDGQYGGCGADGVKGQDGGEAGEFFGHTTGEPATKGQAGGKGGAGGNGGNAGCGGSRGTIRVYAVRHEIRYYDIDFPAHWSPQTVGIQARAGRNGKPGSGGSGGRGMPGGLGGRPWVSREKTFWEKVFSNPHIKVVERGPRLESGADGQNGAAGRPGVGVGVTAADDLPNRRHEIQRISHDAFRGQMEGPDGATPLPIDRFSGDARACPNLEQLYLSMNKAKRLYLSARSKSEYEEVVWLLSWIHFVTPSPTEVALRRPIAERIGRALIDDKDRSDAGLVKGQDHETDRRIDRIRTLTSLRAFAARYLAEADELEALHVKSGALLGQLAEGLDFFGHTRDWAPIVQLDLLGQQLDRLFSAAGRIEDLYTSYQKLGNDQAAWEAEIGAALSAHEENIGESQSALNAIVEERQSIEASYPKLAQDVFGKEVELRTACGPFLSDLKTTLLIDAGKDMVKTAAAIYAVGSGSAQALSVASSALSQLKQREAGNKPEEPLSEAMASPTKPTKPVEIEMTPLHRF